MTPTPAAVESALNWNGLEKILRGMRARNEAGSLELTNWIADNRGRAHQPPTDEPICKCGNYDTGMCECAHALPVELEGDHVPYRVSRADMEAVLRGKIMGLETKIEMLEKAQSPARVNREAIEALKTFVDDFDETRSQFMGQCLQIRNSTYDAAKRAIASAEQLERSKS